VEQQKGESLTSFGIVDCNSINFYFFWHKYL
jgi:hypothetical protein